MAAPTRGPPGSCPGSGAAAGAALARACSDPGGGVQGSGVLPPGALPRAPAGGPRPTCSPSPSRPQHPRRRAWPPSARGAPRGSDPVPPHPLRAAPRGQETGAVACLVPGLGSLRGAPDAGHGCPQVLGARVGPTTARRRRRPAHPPRASGARGGGPGSPCCWPRSGFRSAGALGGPGGT